MLILFALPGDSTGSGPLRMEGQYNIHSSILNITTNCAESHFFRLSFQQLANMKVASHSYLRIRTDPQQIYISAYLECAPFISLDQDTVLTVNKDTNLNSQYIL